MEWCHLMEWFPLVPTSWEEAWLVGGGRGLQTQWHCETEGAPGFLQPLLLASGI